HRVPQARDREQLRHASEQTDHHGLDVPEHAKFPFPVVRDRGALPDTPSRSGRGDTDAMRRSLSPARTPGRRRAWRAASALVVMAATAAVLTACGARSRVASPGGKTIHVQQASLGVTLRTDRHNAVTVTEYRSAVAATGHERARHGMHLEAAELKICATT